MSRLLISNLEISTAKNGNRSFLKVFIWSQLETQLGLACACAPSLRVFFIRYIGRPSSWRISTVRMTSRTSTPQMNPPACTKHGSSTLLRVGSVQAVEDLEAGSYNRAEKHIPSSAVDGSETGSVLTGPPSCMHVVIRTPSEYEAYDLQSIEKYRQSLSRSRL